MNLQSIKRHPVLMKLLQPLRRDLGRFWMRTAHSVCGVKRKTVFFSSFQGRAYSDSPRYISEALHALAPELDIVWQLNDAAAAPDYIRTVRPHTPRALWELATAGTIVDNFNRPVHLLKFDGQFMVQTWHGDRGFKKMMYDMASNTLRYPDGEQIDLAVAGSDFGQRLYRTAFRYNGRVLQVGMPRNDALIHPDADQITDIRKRLNVPKDAKVMLYAPTFRDATMGEDQTANFDITKAVAALEQSTGRKWICLIRAHAANRGIRADFGIDVTAYPEMADLLLAADLLITDYSSSAGDFVLLDRPVILYQPDLDTFMADDREMYFDIRSCPYTRAESEEALLKLLSDFDSIPLCAPAVRDFYGVTEYGHSAEAVAREIIAAL